MNRQQVKYAEDRLQQVKRDKLKEWTNKYPKPNDLSFSDKLKMIRAGSAKLNKDIKDCYSVNFYRQFTYPEQVKVDKLIKAWSDSKIKFEGGLNDLINKSVDELYLGDTEGALSAITQVRGVKV